MTLPNVSSSDETLPPGRVVRWLMLAGVILLSVGLYFRFGLHTPPMGAAPAPAPAPAGAATTSTP
jgi:hypothetical protein